MSTARTFDKSVLNQTLFEALVRARDTFGKSTIAIRDADGTELTYGRLVIGALVLGKKLSKLTSSGENVGVLLPNAAGAVVGVFGLLAYARVPALLNFTAGSTNVRSAVVTAQIKTVVTSRRFVSKGGFEDLIAALETRDPANPAFEPVRIIYLEDVRETVGTWDKLSGAVGAMGAKSIARKHGAKPNAPGIILFTSGSEGRPKGVVLSHANLCANVEQILVQDGGGVLLQSDIVMNPLPMFHSFGLTGGCLLGLFNGMKIELFPSPLQYREITKQVAKTKATILFGTDTFLRGYARTAAPGDLDSLRMVVAGAEKVKDDTRRMFAEVGAMVVEGYGATECSPVLSVNSPRDNRAGTVGKPVAGMEMRLEAIEGYNEGSRLSVRGPNVMLGYLFADNPGQLVPPEGGWHDTGDLVAVDDDGFIHIRGRVKRFAKIGGEMVSFAAVESMVAAKWPEANHVVTSMPDARKGEQLVLVTDSTDIERPALLAHAKAEGFPELWVPRGIVPVAEIPVLGSGKVNFGAVQDIVRTAQVPA